MKVLSGEEKISCASQEEEEEVAVKENQSINSAVINGLFEGILEQSEEQKDRSDDDEEEEEDALNISSMSLLTPLAETVAAVVKSPDRRMMVTLPSHWVLTGSCDVLLMSVRLSADLNSCHLLRCKEQHSRRAPSTHQVPDEQPGGERLLRQHGLPGPGSQAAIQVGSTDWQAWCLL